MSPKILVPLTMEAAVTCAVLMLVAETSAAAEMATL